MLDKPIPSPADGHLEALHFHDDGPWAVFAFECQDGPERRVEFPVYCLDPFTGEPTRMSANGRWLDGEEG